MASKLTAFLNEAEASFFDTFIEAEIPEDQARAAAKKNGMRLACKNFGKTEAEIRDIVAKEAAQGLAKVGSMCGVAFRYGEAKVFPATVTKEDGTVKDAPAPKREEMPDSFQRRLALVVSAVGGLMRGDKAVLDYLPTLREIEASGDVPTGVQVANVSKLQTSGTVKYGNGEGSKSPHADEDLTMDHVKKAISIIEFIEDRAAACEAFLNDLPSLRDPYGISDAQDVEQDVEQDDEQDDEQDE